MLYRLCADCQELAGVTTPSKAKLANRLALTLLADAVPPVHTLAPPAVSAIASSDITAEVPPLVSEI